MSSMYPLNTIFFRRPALLWPSAVLALALFAGQAGDAQQNPAGNPSSAGRARKSPSPHAKAVAAPAVAEPVPAQPVPEIPKWPVNDTPNKPSVTWNASGLKIQANNASLHDILNQVSTDTGAKVEGLGTDERVFGEYGPGTARDVISQLLHGSSYNVLMIGDQGAGTPRQIVLSARRNVPNQAQGNRPTPQDQPDEDVPEQPEVDEQPPMQPPMVNGGRPPMPEIPQGPPGAPRTPQQVLQELQQRQQQILEQQQQQQQQPH